MRPTPDDLWFMFSEDGEPLGSQTTKELVLVMRIVHGWSSEGWKLDREVCSNKRRRDSAS